MVGKLDNLMVENLVLWLAVLTVDTMVARLVDKSVGGSDLHSVVSKVVMMDVKLVVLMVAQ
jgi:hypothetical protein